MDSAPGRRGPVLVYLPGLHGDGTLISSFHQVVRDEVRFVGVRYPRSATAGLAHYARGIADTLARAGIDRGWLLGESFGSQVGWALLEAGWPAQGFILAGGFVRHPWNLGVHLARLVCGHTPGPVLRAAFWLYPRYARFRHRRAPETRAAVAEFVRHRLAPGDREAMTHRLRLIAAADFRPAARQATVPVWSVTGFWDPLVPWPQVHRWLRHHCPTFQGARVLPWADHNVLATQPEAAARIIRRWLAS